MKKLKTALVGSVGSARVVLERMIACGSPPALVLSLDEESAEQVSGYVPIHLFAEQNGIPAEKFRKIGDARPVKLLRDLAPDYIFVIGLSQLVGEEVLSAAKCGVVGFHPTKLPKGRGRAAIVWQILTGVRDTACTMFLIDAGADSGPVLAQEPYTIEEGDYASDVGKKVLDALARLTDRVLEGLAAGTLAPVPQNDAEATYYLRRAPEDGRIDWNLPAAEILTLIRAASHPYPGAYSLYEGAHKVIFWRAELLENKRFVGFSGQIAQKCEDALYIVCKDGLLKVTDYTLCEEHRLLAGHRFYS